MQIPSTPCKYPPHLPELGDILVKPKGEMRGRDVELVIQQVMGGLGSVEYNAPFDLRNGAGKVEVKFSERHQGGRYNFSNIVGLEKDLRKWDLLILVGRRACRISSETSLDSEFFFICLTWDESIELLRDVSGRGSFAIPEWRIPGSTALPTYSRRPTRVQEVLVRNFRTATELRVMERQARKTRSQGAKRPVIRRTRQAAIAPAVERPMVLVRKRNT